jgi:hypothetical protein
MQGAVRREAAIMILLACLAGVVFVETRGLTASAGQISPAFFPQLGAGVILALAAVRLGAIALVGYRPHQAEIDWSWSAARRPAAITLLMLGFYAGFGTIPFSLLTFVFLVLAFRTFDVRPWGRILAGAALGTAFFYLLFEKLFRLPV